MPPLVDTEFSAPINGQNGIKPIVVAQDFISALEKDEYEIRVGKTQYIYDLYLKSPAGSIECYAACINNAVPRLNLIQKAGEPLTVAWYITLKAV